MFFLQIIICENMVTYKARIIYFVFFSSYLTGVGDTHTGCEQFFVNFFVFKSEGAKESLEEKEEPLWKDGNKKTNEAPKVDIFQIRINECHSLHSKHYEKDRAVNISMEKPLLVHVWLLLGPLMHVGPVQPLYVASSVNAGPLKSH